ncbi:MAG TPA: response regulator [Dongiaceae bacterium]|jgi:two-component system response regulator FixJ|nr:response regulator [Dongiaceae bacterium]
MACDSTSQIRPARTTKGTIYIVDDDESVRDSARALLEAYDHVVEDFASARDILARFDELAEGCMLLDLNMPEMGGIELLELLRGRGDTIPVIVVTAQNDPGVLDRARRAGAFAVLEKPVDDTLIETIGRALASA